jgi:hypothetical protein
MTLDDLTITQFALLTLLSLGFTFFVGLAIKLAMEAARIPPTLRSVKDEDSVPRKVEEPTGEAATQVAEIAGVDRSYIYDAKLVKAIDAKKRSR